MSHLKPEKLHVDFDEKIVNQKSALERKYTLTHSDFTGDLFLAIGADYDKSAISGWYTKLMRDEVLGVWVDDEELTLHLHLHVSGGLVFGPPKWRESIFKQHLPLVLEAICYGDRAFIKGCESCLNAPIRVHFHAKQAKLDHVEVWGKAKNHLP